MSAVKYKTSLYVLVLYSLVSLMVAVRHGEDPLTCVNIVHIASFLVGETL